jgi:hypothetical protein
MRNICTLRLPFLYFLILKNAYGKDELMSVVFRYWLFVKFMKCMSLCVLYPRCQIIQPLIVTAIKRILCVLQCSFLSRTLKSFEVTCFWPYLCLIISWWICSGLITVSYNLHVYLSGCLSISVLQTWWVSWFTKQFTWSKSARFHIGITATSTTSTTPTSTAISRSCQCCDHCIWYITNICPS